MSTSPSQSATPPANDTAVAEPYSSNAAAQSTAAGFSLNADVNEVTTPHVSYAAALTAAEPHESYTAAFTTAEPLQLYAGVASAKSPHASDAAASFATAPRTFYSDVSTVVNPHTLYASAHYNPAPLYKYSAPFGAMPRESNTNHTPSTEPASSTNAPLLSSKASQGSVPLTGTEKPANISTLGYSASSASVENVISRMQLKLETIERLLNTTLEQLHESQQQRQIAPSVPRVDRALPTPASQQPFDSGNFLPLDARNNLTYVCDGHDIVQQSAVRETRTINNSVVQQSSSSSKHENVIQQPHFKEPNSVAYNAVNALPISSTLVEDNIRQQPVISSNAAVNNSALQANLGKSYSQYFGNTVESQEVINTNYASSTLKQPPEITTFNPWLAVPRKLQDLPEFKGEPEVWPMFSTAYNHSTAAYKYTKFENCSRLQKSLKGIAYETVKSLLIHPDNVDDVMQQLEFRFGRPELLIASQLREVREIMPISEAAVGKLIPFSTKTKNLAAFLQAANANHHLANPTLIEELISKLPISKKIEWARFAEPIKPYPTVLDFSNWLSEVANIISTINIETPESKRRTVMHTNVYNVIEPGECPVCNENHKIYYCKEFLKKGAKDRWDEVKRLRLCFSCLGKRHSSQECRRKKRCSIKGCTRIHNKLLHEDDINNCLQTEMRVESDVTQSVISCATKQKVNKLLFRILPVTVHGKSGHVSTYALLDEGSSITLIDKSVIDELGLNGTYSNLDLQWINGTTRRESATIVDICINGVGRNDIYTLHNVHAVENLNLPVQSFEKSDFGETLKGLNIPQIVEYENAQPKLLIGLDNCHLSQSTETIASQRDGPFAANTKLGWVVFGASRGESNSPSSCLFVNPIVDAAIHDMVSEYFTSESFGVRAALVVESDDDVRARQILQATTKLLNSRYEIGLLWRHDDILLPDSFSMAKKRLVNIKNKMKRDSVFSNAYRTVMQSYIEKGYARKLTHAEAERVTPRTWYLPHFAVVNVNKPKKLRLVFDAAATVGNVSLNSCLLKGPQDYQPLPSVLFNFRIGSVALSADIKEMFHQVLIRPEDRCAQRFLWRDGNQDRPLDVYEMVVMTFGAACSPCAAQHVKIENAKRHTHHDPRAIKAIVQHHYVDDFVDSFDSVESAIRISKQVKDIHNGAGFELRGFTSNVCKVAKDLNGDQSSEVTHGDKVLATEKVLGMVWHATSDTFRYQLKFHRVSEEVISANRVPTKRELLSIIMSVFDPLGLMSHLMITAKLIMREVWRYEVKWDDQIPEEINGAWISWRDNLHNALQVKVPRHYFFNGLPIELQLHIFVDASETAFAAVAYWRTINDLKNIDVILVCAKTRCAPQKPMTVPRLELQAAVLGVRLMQTIILEHDLTVSECVFWSDSSTVIKWIQSKNRRYKPFVAHRINEILNASEVQQWRWVPTQHNVADDATRLRHNTDLNSSSRWFTGPSFLREKSEKWPSRVDLRNFICDDEGEVMKDFVLLNFNSSFIDFTRFSTFTKLKRSVAWALRFINACRFHSNFEKSSTLTVAEQRAAENIIIYLIQSQVFAPEIQQIERGKSLQNGTSLYSLMPYKDPEGILRVNGRINAAGCLPYDTKHPIILPPDHEVTALILQHFHNYMRHQNFEATICEIRQRFWVPRLRQILQKTIRNCSVCKLMRATPVAPAMGPLPEDRLTPYVRPFTYTGIDYFGPLLVSIGRRREKRCVALFTCLTTRAIHLEIAFDLSTDACILVIRNFINRRGTPLRIRSDNGKNFVGLQGNAQRFSEVFDNVRIQDELSCKGVEWLFNCPLNPSEGGVWERMVRCVKRVLNQIMKEVAPREQTLQSFLIEAENVVNSRPLTHIPVTADEEEPITPNHFLLGCANTVQTPALYDISEKPYAMQKQWRISRQLRDHFWKRWIREYLPTLTRREKWCERSEPIKLGDLVLICDLNVPRTEWRRGRVENVYTGKDGVIRRADVRTKAGLLQRPVSKLAILDVRCGESSQFTEVGLLRNGNPEIYIEA